MPRNTIIWLDCTQISVVVKCRHCPWWSAFAFTKDEGWAAGAAHEQRAHPDSTQARNTLLVRRRRAVEAD